MFCWTLAIFTVGLFVGLGFRLEGFGALAILGFRVELGLWGLGFRIWAFGLGV